MKNKGLIALALFTLAACGKDVKKGSIEGSSVVPPASCALQNPVPLSNDPLNFETSYFDVQLDHPIKTRTFESPQKKTDLKFRIFNVRHVGSGSTVLTAIPDTMIEEEELRTGLLGFDLENNQARQSTGFPDAYLGQLDANGIIEVENDTKTYTTQDPTRGLHLQVRVAGGNILSVEFMIDGVSNCIRSMRPFF